MDIVEKRSYLRTRMWSAQDAARADPRAAADRVAVVDMTTSALLPPSCARALWRVTSPSKRVVYAVGFVVLQRHPGRCRDQTAIRCRRRSKRKRRVGRGGSARTTSSRPLPSCAATTRAH
jgi:hypothetical protein